MGVSRRVSSRKLNLSTFSVSFVRSGRSISCLRDDRAALSLHHSLRSQISMTSFQSVVLRTPMRAVCWRYQPESGRSIALVVTYALRACSRALLTSSKPAFPLGSRGAAAGGYWLLMAARGHAAGAPTVPRVEPQGHGYPQRHVTDDQDQEEPPPASLSFPCPVVPAPPPRAQCNESVARLTSGGHLRTARPSNAS